MAYVDAIDSFYQAIKARIVAQSIALGQTTPLYPAKGLLEAQDWPNKDAISNAFYLLTLDDKAVGRQMYSATVPVKFHLVQWVWIITGTDLQSGQRAENRGDRFRVGQAMKDVLTNAHYPNFAEKKSWALSGANWVGTSLVPPEFITWSPVEFAPKSDQASGVIYGAAGLRIWNMLDSIPS